MTHWHLYQFVSSKFMKYLNIRNLFCNSVRATLAKSSKSWAIFRELIYHLAKSSKSWAIFRGLIYHLAKF